MRWTVPVVAVCAAWIALAVASCDNLSGLSGGTTDAAPDDTAPDVMAAETAAMDAALGDAPDGGPEAAAVDAAMDGSMGPAFDGYCGCSANGCTPVVVAQSPAPLHVVADSKGVYWNDAKTEAIEGVEFGGATHTLVDDGGLGPSTLALTTSQVIWADAVGGNIAACARPGCATTTVLGPTTYGARSMALTASDVFITTVIGLASCPITGCPTGVAPLAMLPPAGADNIVSDGTNLYFLHANAVWTCAIASCAPTQLSPTESVRLQGLAYGNGKLFWGANTDIQSCAVSSCTNPTTLYPGSAANQPRAVAADSVYVYWTDVAAGMVVRGAQDGSLSTQLATNRPQPSPLALGDTCVFWGEGLGSPGSIVAIAR